MSKRESQAKVQKLVRTRLAWGAVWQGREYERAEQEVRSGSQRGPEEVRSWDFILRALGTTAGLKAALAGNRVTF